MLIGGAVSAFIKLIVQSEAKTEAWGAALIGKPVTWWLKIFDVPYVAGEQESRLKLAILRTPASFLRGAVNEINRQIAEIPIEAQEQVVIKPQATE